jgi:hypothetical protein
VGWWGSVRDLRIRTIALLARELESHDPRDIGLERQNLQIEHQLDVIGERGGDTHRPICIGYSIAVNRFLRALDFALDLTDAIEILVHPCAVLSAYTLLELGDVRSE